MTPHVGSIVKLNQHFLHLRRTEREKVTLHYITRFRIQWKRSGLLAFNEICEPIIREKKMQTALIIRRERKNKKKYTAVIARLPCHNAGCALNTLNLWRVRRAGFTHTLSRLGPI